MVLKEKERIPKLVLLPSTIECKGWSLADKENAFRCYACKGSLFYVRQEWGVVDEGPMDIQICNHKDKSEPRLAMRVVGLALYCAECGNFNEEYYKYFYPKDNQVCSWDDEDLDIADIEELKMAINTFNRIGKVELPYESAQISVLKRQIEEYFKKNTAPKKDPIKKKKKKKGWIN